MISEDEKLFRVKNRLLYVSFLILLFFAAIILRLFYLQILSGNTYARLATEVVVREDEVIARRGKIFDRNGIVLADTRVYFEITLTRQYVSDLKTVVQNLSQILPVNAEEILEKVKNSKEGRRYQPIPIVKDIPYDWAAKLSEYLNQNYDPMSAYDLSGIEVSAHPIRRYHYPESFAHALGYLREINKKQLNNKKKYPDLYYSRGDWIGVSGLERQYDFQLKGMDGKKVRIVDAKGKEVDFSSDIQILKEKLNQDSKAGFHLKTSLDLYAQQAAREAFPEDKRGAVVAIEPQTGEVLVLYSHPSFNNNELIQNIKPEFWQMLTQNRMLYNLAIQGEYPPASTYKPVGVMAGIEGGQIDPKKTKHRCTGGHRYGRRTFRCWKRSGHGLVDAVLALGQSCDVFFYRVGLEVGIDNLSKIAERFGLNHKTGIDLPGEKKGHIPNSKNRKNMHSSDILSLSIGQSYNLVTPLQLAKMSAMIANGGVKIKPHLGKEILEHNGKVIQKIKTKTQETQLIDHEAMEWIQKGMHEVVHGRGTARKLKQSPNDIAGKTGTAQIFRYDKETKKLVELEDHALFIGYAPFDDPKIAVAVVVEHGGGGSRTAAPIAMKVIDAYLNKNQKTQELKP